MQVFDRQRNLDIRKLAFVPTVRRQYEHFRMEGAFRQYEGKSSMDPMYNNPGWKLTHMFREEMLIADAVAKKTRRDSIVCHIRLNSISFAT